MSREQQPGSDPPSPSEVRSYVLRLVALIILGVVVMTVVAVMAWRTYGGRLEAAPALPEGTPPLSTVPAE